MNGKIFGKPTVKPSLPWSHIYGIPKRIKFTINFLLPQPVKHRAVTNALSIQVYIRTILLLLITTIRNNTIVSITEKCNK